ncbi:AAA family ATPase [Baekduia soli]|uniref:AAA family ATPase n=1 Tax=Baekduia soli TaxID=496014 RepID=A0A5B8U2T9_9ACTN|nr:AAA family ATPase [Baekduia soli]QEC47288.1 AAA family ATPase [Baekduia soli]
MFLSTLKVAGYRAAADGELEVSLPGRFSVLVGANGVGKTTVCDGVVLAHRSVFPRSPTFAAEALGARPRSVSAAYSYEADLSDEGPLGRALQIASGHEAPGGSAGEWTRDLNRQLGVVRPGQPSDSSLLEHLRLVHLPAHRNPLDELARREARVLVELLRAQQQRATGGRDLGGLRASATNLLEALAQHDLIKAIEERIATHLASLSAGVTRQWPYVRGQVVDDLYLARVLELMLATLEGREHARALDVSGLGYVNLLHVAITLAAIPDLSIPLQPTGPTDERGPGESDQQARAAPQADADLDDVAAEAQAEEDSFFPAGVFHATLILEEPEAHLHPQLQHSLIRYLRAITLRRRELQVIVSSHAPDIVSACDPEDLVVLRRGGAGDRRSVAIASVPITDRDDVLRKTRLHLDASRSAALFADRLVLVEGVTEVAVLRELAHVWAAGDPDKQAFVDSLTIVPMGTKVGAWPVRLLATPGSEICSRLAILSDSDKPREIEPSVPDWLADHDGDIARIFFSRPTLEPALTERNEALVSSVLDTMGLASDEPASVDNVEAMFRGSRAARDDRPATPAGAGARRKGEFALEFAARVRLARHKGEVVNVPKEVAELLAFLYEGPLEAMHAAGTTST